MTTNARCRKRRIVGARRMVDMWALKDTWFRWWFPFVIFTMSRIINAVMITAASGRQVALTPWNNPGMFIYLSKAADPGYFDLTTNWDGQWYQYIATEGYPGPSASTDSQGVDPLWAWAFPPLYPMLLRGAMTVTGASMPLVSTVLNFVLGAAAVTVLYRLLERSGGRSLAASGVLLISCFMAAPILQMAYSEALGLLLILGVLLAIETSHFGWAVALTVSLGFTRLVTAPLVAVCLVQFLALRSRPGYRIKNRATIGLVIVATLAVGGIWAWSWAATNLAPASTAASSRTKASSALSFGWFSQGVHYLGWPFGVGVGVFLVALLLLSRSQWTRDWPRTLRSWLWSYPALLMIATPMTGGILRYLLLCPAFALLPAGSRDIVMPRIRAIAVGLACIAGLVLQLVYIEHLLVIAPGNLMP